MKLNILYVANSKRIFPVMCTNIPVRSLLEMKCLCLGSFPTGPDICEICYSNLVNFLSGAQKCHKSTVAIFGPCLGPKTWHLSAKIVR